MIFRHLKNRRFPAKENNVKGKLFYDPEEQEPVIRCSICTGEQVAGLRDRKTNAFSEVMLIRDESDLELFKKIAGVDHVRKIY